MSVEQTLRDRGKTHGDFEINSKISQGFKRIMHNSPNWDLLPDTHKETLEMTAHKIGRWLTGDFMHEDNPHDIAGYNILTENDIKKTKDFSHD